jgi:hypothetical protein
MIIKHFSVGLSSVLYVCFLIWAHHRFGCKKSRLITQRISLSFIMPPGTHFEKCCPKWRHVITPVNAGLELITLMVSEGKARFYSV